MKAFTTLIALPVIAPVFALHNPQPGVASTSPSRTTTHTTKLTRLGVAVAFQAVLAGYLYTHGRTVYNAFVDPSLPSGYFAHGDADSSCTQVHMEGLKFCEDAKLWHTADAEGKVIKRVIAACDRNRRDWNTVMGPIKDPTGKGGIYVLTYADDPKKPVLVERITVDKWPEDLDFHPLGLDIIPGAPGKPSTLFVVNHDRVATAVEKIEIDPQTLKAVFTKHLYHPMFWAGNSVAALSPTSILVSNDHFFTRRGPSPWKYFMPMLESVTMMPLGTVIHLDFATGELRTSIAAKGIPFANGVALSPDRKEVAIVACTSAYVQLYSLEENGGVSLKYKTAVKMPFSADNVDYTHDGRLIVAGHPYFPGLVKFSEGKADKAPSWVVEIANRTLTGVTKGEDDKQSPYPITKRAPSHADYSVQTLFMSDGSVYPSSSTGLWDPEAGRMFTTGLYADGILVCTKM